MDEPPYAQHAAYSIIHLAILLVPTAKSPAGKTYNKAGRLKVLRKKCKSKKWPGFSGQVN
jgi:hypothetical protein